MLQQFSWTSFLIFFALSSALWYLALLLSVFRRDAINFFSRGLDKQTSPHSPPSIEAEERQGSSMEQEIMGQSKMPEGLELVTIGELNFSSGQDAGYEQESKSDQLGLVPDVLQELKEIFGILAKEDGNKQDFFAMSALISEKYGRIGSNPNIGKINEFIREQAPFAITLAELENLWD